MIPVRAGSKICNISFVCCQWDGYDALSTVAKTTK